VRRMSLRIGLTAWESEEGADAPTLGQLRLLAAKYHFPVAVFYLPESGKTRRVRASSGGWTEGLTATRSLA
jgi:hypothetical protein